MSDKRLLCPYTLSKLAENLSVKFPASYGKP